MTKRRVAESAPVQVYLGTTERSRLVRLATQLATSNSEIIRRGLLALEREMLDPERHPALAVIGIAVAERSDDGYDAARDHDRLLADSEVTSWTALPPKRAAAKRGARRRGG